ncbi:class I SAM-dependent methyltransferase [Actinoallomurus sp. NPDC050550]|uniref:class I SAM-dependent methyltransferase n=1 Tax=Actinoallomurus sp. NPDC050550 TaxID=3154937 RepID=UPI0033C307E7
MNRKATRAWDGRRTTWAERAEASPALEVVREAIIRHAEPRIEDTCLDLGAGFGFLALPLAAQVEALTAVDASSGLMRRLQEEAAARGLRNVTTLTIDLAELYMPWESFDLIVSNYALHRVDNAAKRRLVAGARRWLRPGGRLVVGDMMFGRGLSAADRVILGPKFRRLATQGPGGWWRIGKNIFRNSRQCVFLCVPAFVTEPSAARVCASKAHVLCAVGDECRVPVSRAGEGRPWRLLELGRGAPSSR